MVWYIIVSDKKLFVSHDYCDEDMSRCFNHFLLLMFIQHFQRPILEYLWIVVPRKIVVLTVKN